MCLYPVRAEQQEIGRPKLSPEGSLLLPCGKCSECKSKRAVEWATRCRHEIACHSDNTFITLTYDEDNLPSSLIVKDYFQKFMKKLRKKVKKKLKYIVSHEYGSRTGRPHHHVIIFGWEPRNQQFLQKAPSGENLYTSKEVDELWTHGFHSIGEANEKTAYYIASYSLKSSTTNVLDDNTGEIVTVTDSMDASRNTAIGKEFFLKNKENIVYNSTILPRYYVKLLERYDENLLQDYQNNLMLSQTNERGIHGRLAKHVITEQKKHLHSQGLRSAPESENSEAFTRYLKHERDIYKSFIGDN